MSAQPDSSKLSVGQFAERFRGDMIPLSTTFSYYCATVPLSEEDLREYLEEPIAALPPSIAAVLPKISLMLVPYLERADKAGEAGNPNQFVCTEKPPENRLSWASQVQFGSEEVLVFALKDQEIAEYHYRLYRRLATLMADQWNDAVRGAYTRLIREELSADAHGEVDDASWTAKQTLLRRQKGARKESPSYTAYLRQSFIDSLTLYLHGLCCDIDVETGPRQLPSRYLRKRLELLRELYPPAEGYVLFPEELT